MPIRAYVSNLIIYMTDISIAQTALLSNKRRTIPIGDLRLGMFVHAIAEQMGKMSVKSKGKVKHLHTIGKLRASGIKTLIVENSSTVNEDASSAPHQQRVDSPSNTLAKDICSRKVERNKAELVEASLLLTKSENIYASFAKKVQRDAIIDFSETKVLVSTVYENLAKNPDALLCMSMIMQSSDYLANHSIHVATLLCYFAQKLDMSKTDCEQLALAGYLFDIGMVRVPEKIRNKKGQLDELEQFEIQRHVNHSLDILAPLNLNRECLLAIEQHHERLDGSGYPHAYSGSKIHKFSRMLAIIDCYDALTTLRKHQQPLLPAAAMKVLSNPEHGYDQKLVLQFVRCMGIYPVGSLVMLSNKQIALVTRTNKEVPNAPEVKIFYCAVESNFVSPTFVNLAEAKHNDGAEKSLRVIKPVLASRYGLSMKQIVL